MSPVRNLSLAVERRDREILLKNSCNNSTKVGIESSVGWRVFLLEEASVPFSDGMGGVAHLSQLVTYGGEFERQAIWLGWPDDVVL